MHKNISLSAERINTFRTEKSTDKRNSNKPMLKKSFGLKRLFQKLSGNDNIRNFFRHLKGQTFTMFLYAQEAFLIIYR